MAKGENITTPFARINFAEIEKPVAFKNEDGTFSKPKYSVTLMFPNVETMKDDRGDGRPYILTGLTEKDVELRGLRAVIEREAKARFPKANLNSLKLGLREGEEGKWSEGYTFLRASTEYPIQLFNRDKTKVDSKDVSTLFYNGAWVRAVVEFYTFDKKGNKGVSAGLRGLQFVAHDSKLAGGQIKAEESFTDLPEIPADVTGAQDELDDLLKD